MGIISGIKNMVLNAVGYQRLRKQTQELKSTAVNLATPQKATRKETFEEALVRLDLKEEDIQKRTKEFKRLITIFSVIGVILVIYLIYALMHKAIFAGAGTSVVLFIVIGQIFHYHFWLFQIRQRRLGCTFKEWLYALVGKKV